MDGRCEISSFSCLSSEDELEQGVSSSFEGVSGSPREGFFDSYPVYKTIMFHISLQ